MAKKTKEDKIEEPQKEPSIDVLEKYGITLAQELFCQYFTSPSEFYGNGTQAYAAAYNLDVNDAKDYGVAKARASALLTSINILTRVDSLLDEKGFNNSNIDKQLLFLITQSADFNAKLGAIKEYNKLKARITEKMEHVYNAPVAIIEVIPLPPKQGKSFESLVEEAVKEQQTNNQDVLTDNTDDSGEGAIEA